jgi:hypothetical protein
MCEPIAGSTTQAADYINFLADFDKKQNRKEELKKYKSVFHHYLPGKGYKR